MVKHIGERGRTEGNSAMRWRRRIAFIAQYLVLFGGVGLGWLLGAFRADQLTIVIWLGVLCVVLVLLIPGAFAIGHKANLEAQEQSEQLDKLIGKLEGSHKEILALRKEVAALQASRQRKAARRWRLW